MTTDAVRLFDSERLELGDLEQATDDGPRSLARQPMSTFMTSPAGDQLWVVDGFKATKPTSTTVQVDRGVAILRQRDGAQVFTGCLTSEGDATKTVDVSALSNGTYGVWIRFELVDSAAANRLFWDESVPGEVPQNVMTRRAANWGMTLATTSPGTEWFKVGEAVVSGGTVSLVTPKRQFFFEGEEDLFGSFAVASASTAARAPASYAVWGAGNDRNTDRAAFGVKDLQTMLAALRVQTEGILDSANTTRWFQAVPEGLAQKFSKSGGTVTGSVDVTGATTLEGSLEVDDISEFIGNVLLDAGLMIGVSDALTTNPTIAAMGVFGTTGTPATRAGAVIQNFSTNNNTIASLFFMHSAADAGIDGVALWSQRNSEDNIDFHIGEIVDGAAATGLVVVRSTGSVQSVGNMIAPKFSPLSSPAPTDAGLANLITKTNVCKAWIYVTFTAAGASANPTVGVLDGFNVGTPVSTGADASAGLFKIPFIDSFADTNYVAVPVHASSSFSGITIEPISNTGGSNPKQVSNHWFLVKVASSGAAKDLTNLGSTNVLGAYILFFGRQ